MHFELLKILARLDFDQGLCDRVCQWDHVLQGEECDPRRGQCGRLWRFCAAIGCHYTEECVGHHDPGGDPLPQGEHRKGDEGGVSEYTARGQSTINYI